MHRAVRIPPATLWQTCRCPFVAEHALPDSSLHDSAEMSYGAELHTRWCRDSSDHKGGCDGTKQDCLERGKRLCNSQANCYGVMYHPGFWSAQHSGFKLCTSAALTPKNDWITILKNGVLLPCCESLGASHPPPPPPPTPYRAIRHVEPADPLSNRTSHCCLQIGISWICGRGRTVRCARTVRALCEKLAVLHHREFGKFRRLKDRH